MPDNPQYAESFIDDILGPWEELAADAVFAETTLEQFRKAVKSSLDRRADIKSLETQLISARQSRNLADVDSVELCLKVVNGVKSSSKFGENSSLYKAMGYITKLERKSGLVRPAANKPVPEKPPVADPKPESEKVA